MELDPNESVGVGGTTAGVAAAAKSAAHVIDHLVRLDVGMRVRHLDRFGVGVEHARGECAQDESSCFKRLVNRRRLVDGAGDRLEVVGVERERIEIAVPADRVERVRGEHVAREALAIPDENRGLFLPIDDLDFRGSVQVALIVRHAQAPFAVRVQVNPSKLKAQKIGLNEVDLALQNWNVDLPTGQLFGSKLTHNVHVGGQLINAKAFRPMVVAYRRGRAVRLEDVADVIDSVEDDKNIAWLYDKHQIQREVYLSVFKQPGANTIEVADAIRGLLPVLEKAIPPSVHLSPRTDRSLTIRQAFIDIQITMLVTLVLVVGVIFAFLRNRSATIIPALALPFSILGTFAVMKVLNYTIDNLSAMALILSIGFVVDDAIVMLENIVRHMEQGEGALRRTQRISGDRLRSSP